MADLLRFQGSNRHWDIVFTRAVQIGNWNRWFLLWSFYTHAHLVKASLDSPCWRASHHKKFEVKFYYKVLLQVEPASFPWRTVWRSKVPPRVAFFIWSPALGKILTIDNLRRRRVTIMDWYCMCKVDGESVNHLLLHCPVALELWNLVLALFGVVWVMPKGVELLCCWAGRFGKFRAGAIWKIIPHCLM